MHDFAERLRFSHSASDWDGWEKIYRVAFPSMVTMVDHRQDGWHQRAGIDRSVILGSSKQILIDEKVREKDYGPPPDILIEYMSNDQRLDPGWAEKPLLCDYIAYAVLPRGQAYLLPVEQLQRAWAENKRPWIERFGTKAARNCGYNTLNCAVPVDLLFPAIGKALRVAFNPVRAA